HAVLTCGSRPTAMPQAHWRAAHGDRRAGSRWRPGDPNGWLSPPRSACALGQVLAGAGRSDCYIYCSRSTLLDTRIFHDFCHSLPDDCYDTTHYENGVPGPRVARGQHNSPEAERTGYRRSSLGGQPVAIPPIQSKWALSNPRVLTEKEVERLMKAAGSNRYGHRDAP